MQIEKVDNATRLIHEPGNGTRYEAIGVILPFAKSNGTILVAFPLLGTSHIFQPGSYVAYSYVEEKLGRDRHGRQVAETDLHEMCKLVAVLTGGTHDAKTDSTGHLAR